MNFQKCLKNYIIFVISLGCFVTGAIACKESSVTSSASKESFQPKDLLENLNQHLITLIIKKTAKNLILYKPNAPWIIQDLLCLKVPHFGAALNYIVQFTTGENRWQYVCNKKEEFDEDRHNEFLLWQCSCYNWFFEHLYCNFQTLDLVCIDTKEDRDLYKNTKLTKWLDFCELTAQMQGNTKDLQTVAQFYAFYFDCLSRHFYKVVHEAYIYKQDDHQKFLSIIKKLKHIIALFERCLSFMKNTDFYNNYYFSVKNYKEIITLLQQEKYE